MVSGDHIESARKTALQSGLISKADLSNKDAVMHANEFKRRVGTLVQRRDPETDEIVVEVENKEAFRSIADNLKVLARASSYEKHLLVVGLRSIGKNVAVTGDGINDVESMKGANVGLAMGSGCSIVRDQADIILTNDDFKAAVKAIMWGRNVFLNISKFLQFQVTINISVLLTIFAGIIVFGESPLTPVQLLWINLIMDTFAAIALSAEPPFPKVLKSEPFKKDTKVLSDPIWK